MFFCQVPLAPPQPQALQAQIAMPQQQQNIPQAMPQQQGMQQQQQQRVRSPSFDTPTHPCSALRPRPPTAWLSI
jgi:hypothetical protein